MPYGIQPEGFVLKTFDVIREEIDESMRTDISRGLLLSDDDPLGIINAIMTQKLSELWELAQTIWSNGDPDTALNWSLDQLAALTGTKRSGWSRTTVLGQVTLNPNSNLPEGSTAHLEGRPGLRFLTVAEVPANPSGGTFDVLFEAEQEGSIDVLPGQLNTISVSQPGWTAVNNTDSGIPGSQPENDPDFRNKRERELASTGSANIDAIISAVSQVSGVVDVKGVDNQMPVPMPYPDAPPVAAHSTFIIVRGGTDQDVAEAIFNSKSAGINTTGNVTMQVTDSVDNIHPVRFQRAFAVNTYANITVEAKPGMSVDTDKLTQDIVNYINSLRIGDNVIYLNVASQAFKQDSVLRVDSCVIGPHPPTSTNDVTISAVQYAYSEASFIDVTVI